MTIEELKQQVDRLQQTLNQLIVNFDAVSKRDHKNWQHTSNAILKLTRALAEPIERAPHLSAEERERIKKVIDWPL